MADIARKLDDQAMQSCPVLRYVCVRRRWPAAGPPLGSVRRRWPAAAQEALGRAYLLSTEFILSKKSLRAQLRKPAINIHDPFSALVLIGRPTLHQAGPAGRAASLNYAPALKKEQGLRRLQKGPICQPRPFLNRNISDSATQSCFPSFPTRVWRSMISSRPSPFQGTGVWCRPLSRRPT